MYVCCLIETGLLLKIQCKISCGNLQVFLVLSAVFSAILGSERMRPGLAKQNRPSLQLRMTPLPLSAGILGPNSHTERDTHCSGDSCGTALTSSRARYGQIEEQLTQRAKHILHFYYIEYTLYDLTSYDACHQQIHGITVS